MGLTSITLENFKAFGDEVTIPIRPITLLYGRNGTGKSSFAEALLIARSILADCTIGCRLPVARLADKARRWTHNVDPEKRLRIRLDFADMPYDYETCWAEVEINWDGYPGVLTGVKDDDIDLELGPIVDAITALLLRGHMDFAMWTWYSIGSSGELLDRVNDHLRRLFGSTACIIRTTDTGGWTFHDERQGIDILDPARTLRQALASVVGLLSTAEPKPILIMDKPEAGLHPRAQLEMGDLLIAGRKAHPKRSMIVETHSDNIILRLLQRVRETYDCDDRSLEHSLAAEDIVLVHMTTGDDKVKPYFVHDDGGFTWPQEIFDEHVAEMM